MGITNISIGNFPKQSELLGKQVEVFFQGDRENTMLGKIVRSDSVEPFQVIIQLEDGKFILDSECRYQVLDY